MGLPGKPKGFDGSEVERYFREGKIKEVADYCETDVVGMAAVRTVSRHAEPECIRGEPAELSGFHECALKSSREHQVTGAYSFYPSQQAHTSHPGYV